MELTANRFEPNFEDIKETAYNNLSDTAKQIVDEQLKVITKEIHHYAEAHEDIVVPYGKILTGIGYRNALGGEILRYNQNDNKYYSDSGGMGFEVEDICKGKFTDK